MFLDTSDCPFQDHIIDPHLHVTGLAVGVVLLHLTGEIGDLAPMVAEEVGVFDNSEEPSGQPGLLGRWSLTVWFE